MWFPHQSVHAIAELFWSQDNCFKCTFLIPDSGSMHWLTSCYRHGSEIVLIWEHLFQAVWLIFVQALPSCCTPIWVWSYIFWCTWCVIFPVSVCFAWDWKPVKKVAKTHWPSCAPASQLAACSRAFCQDLLDKSEMSYLRTFLMEYCNSCFLCWSLCTLLCVCLETSK